MYVDPSGHFDITATMIWAVIGAAIGFGAAYIPDVIENVKADGFQWSDLNTFEGNWQHYIGATLGGAEAGANAISGMLTFTGAMVGGIMGVKVLGAEFSFKNFALYHLGAAYFGIYSIKIILAYIKKKLKERY